MCKPNKFVSNKKCQFYASDHNLWREFERIMTDPPGAVDVWVVDWSQESYFWRLKWISASGIKQIRYVSECIW